MCTLYCSNAMMGRYVGLFKKQRIFVKRILKKIKSDALWCEPTALVLYELIQLHFLPLKKFQVDMNCICRKMTNRIF